MCFLLVVSKLRLRLGGFPGFDAAVDLPWSCFTRLIPVTPVNGELRVTGLMYVDSYWIIRIIALIH